MGLDDLNIPVKIAQKINEALSFAGISLPLVVTQLFLLALSTAALFYGVCLLRNKGAKNLLGILVTVGFGLMAAGVLFAWGANVIYPLPGEISGQVELVPPAGEAVYSRIRVKLLNFRNENIAMGSGVVDTRTGIFALHYTTSYGDSPRILLITAPGSGCAPAEYPLTREQLRANSLIHMEYRCGGVQ